ncbi:MAG: hypothetical protein ACOCXC_00840 [Fibrobacterota bacterium]
MKKSFVCVLSYLLFVCGSLFADDQSLAVLPLHAKGMEESDAAVLTDVLRSKIGEDKNIGVIERSRMEEILKEQGFQMSGVCSESSCAVQAGQVLGVKNVAMGSVGLIGKTYTLNVRIVDVSSGKIEKEVVEYHKGSKDGLLTDVVPLVVSKLTGRVQKKSRKGLWIGLAAGAVAVGVAVPVVIFSLNKEDKDTDSGLEWNE